MARIGEWLPEMVAYVYSAEGLAGPDTEKHLRRLEGGVAMRVMALIQSVLQMAVTTEGPFYDPALLEERLRGTLATARIISEARERADDRSGYAS